MYAWAAVALALLGAHAILTLIQSCDLWWAWRQPNRRSARYFRQARRRLLLALLFPIVTAILIIYIIHYSHVPT